MGGLYRDLSTFRQQSEQIRRLRWRLREASVCSSQPMGERNQSEGNCSGLSSAVTGRAPGFHLMKSDGGRGPFRKQVEKFLMFSCQKPLFENAHSPQN